MIELHSKFVLQQLSLLPEGEEDDNIEEEEQQKGTNSENNPSAPTNDSNLNTTEELNSFVSPGKRRREKNINIVSR